MILVSACLAGIPCKYDGGHSRYPVVEALLKAGKAVAVCPERLGGLSIPRPPAEISGGDGRLVLAGSAEVYDRIGNRVTDAFILGAEKCLEIARRENVRVGIMKNRSPSCGVSQIYDGSFSGNIIDGCGVAAALLMRHGINLFSEESDIETIGEAIR
ncbi:MAG: DUF523 domain-containing protein, partial [Syntrophomonadaceae bacterium]|nr:DUF523 domain-containing protein [Syntrophomonadaceae bacterium]